MAYSQQQLLCDASSVANFKAMFQPLSAFIASCGFFVQAGDSGQVNWTTIAAVPGTNTYVYEVWQSNDGLATFYLKLEYGNVASANSPTLRLTLCTGTNGAGTPTGYILGPIRVATGSFTNSSPTTPYECNFFGLAGVLAAMFWRNGTASSGTLPAFFAIERSLNTSGAYTSSYVTLWTCGQGHGSNQFSLVFGVGPALFQDGGGNGLGMVARVRNYASEVLAGNTPFDLCQPDVGYFDTPCTVVGAALANDVTEALTFTPSNGKTYLPSKNGTFAQAHIANNNSIASAALCMRIA